VTGAERPVSELVPREDRRRRPRSGLLGALGDLVGSVTPLSLRSLQGELEDRVRKIPTHLNEYGYDGFGLSADFVADNSMLSALLYRYYFRAQTHDIDRVPPGRVMLVANHAGQLPFDGMMLSMAMLLEAEPPRIARGMAEYWVSRLPFVSVAAARGGTMVGTPHNCVRMLEDGECVMVFPEGVGGMNKLYRDRYKLQRFGQGFMRLALQSGSPIVPVAIIGSEEQQPGLLRVPGLARLLGIPAFPITPSFPLLGPLGLLPMPVRYHIYFGEPLQPEGDADDEDRAIEEQVERVKRRIETMFDRGLRERRGVFR